MLPRIVVACSALLVLSGCGASPEPTPAASPSPTTVTPSQSATTPVTPSPTPTPTPTKKPSPMPTSPAPSPAPTGAPQPAHDAAPRGAKDLSGARIPQFVNAAMDTTCLFDAYDGISVRCDVLEPRWRVAKPASCQDAYGDAVTLGVVARLLCHGDTIFSPDVTLTLKAGQSAKFKGMWCTVASASVSCQNADGHGFTVSKGSYTLR